MIDLAVLFDEIYFKKRKERKMKKYAPITLISQSNRINKRTYMNFDN